MHAKASLTQHPRHDKRYSARRHRHRHSYRQIPIHMHAHARGQSAYHTRRPQQVFSLRAAIAVEMHASAAHHLVDRKHLHTGTRARSNKVLATARADQRKRATVRDYYPRSRSMMCTQVVRPTTGFQSVMMWCTSTLPQRAAKNVRESRAARVAHHSMHTDAPITSNTTQTPSPLTPPASLTLLTLHRHSRQLHTNQRAIAVTHTESRFSGTT